MKKVYRLEELDCANCAMKIERNIQKLSGVHEVSVDFVQKKMFVKYDEESLDSVIKKTIKELEPEVRVVDITPKKKLQKQQEHHHEQEETCGCGHDPHHEHDEEGCCCKEEHEHHHEHEETCGCGHDHHHEHDDEEGCCCKEEHEHHHEHEETCGCGCGHEHHHEDRELHGAEKLYVKGLDCASCAMKVEEQVKKIKGVKDASMNFSTSVLFVELEEQSRKEELLQLIINKIPTIEDGVVVSREQSTEEQRTKLSVLKENWRLFVGILVFAIAILLEDQPYSFWIFLLAYGFAGGKVVLVALKNILKGEVFDENFLMSVATIGAFFVQSYEEAVAVMIFYEIGEMFQSYAVNRSRKSISSLMNIRADYAVVLMDGQSQKVQPEEVNVGDIILVKPGERVPLDGIVLEGNSSLDTSALTGESMPREVGPQEDVLAGVVNLSGVLQLRVTKEYGESTVSRILELVENASSKKAPMEKFITKFAKIYTPIVVLLAVMVAIIPMLVLEDAVFYDWLYRALTFLVVSCPCALVISVPLGMFAGIGAASKQGVLIKGGNYLEALKRVDTVVFDKTGTLTKGIFAVSELHAKDGDVNRVLALAAYAEYYSNHPIAASIRKAYNQDIKQEDLSQYKEVAGNGVSVQYLGKELLAGNQKLMQEHGIAFDEATAIGTIIHVAYDDQYVGYVLIADEIKETSKQAITSLKASGVKKCVMLSGDRQEVGDYVASQLALDEVHMQLLPVDKVEQVERLLEQEQAPGKLAFVGDGINDAPVLARADVGIAMGGIGSDAAIEAADIVLMKDDPESISVAIRIAKKTMRILWQNIAFSLGVKAIILVLTVFGYSNMWMGVFADVGVTLLAVINSMRALRTK